MTYTKQIIGDATLFLGDCYELLADGRKFWFEDTALVSDPPYLFNTSGGGALRKSRKYVDLIAEHGLDKGFEFDRLQSEKFGTVVLFCHNDQLPDLLAKVKEKFHRFALCAWHKSNAMPVANKHYKPDTEFYIHAWRKDGHPIGDLRDLGRYIIAPVGKSEWDHPTVKPLAVMDKVVRNVQGDIILDPFMGTGSTGIAALRAGRKFVGIEKNPKFFDIAVRRVEDFYKSPTLGLVV